MSAIVHVGNVFDILPTLEAGSVNCVVTSPPYWGLRDYGTEGQLGLEPTPELYVANLVAVFREVRRVLRDDGTLWLVLGDSYAGSNQTGGDGSSSTLTRGGKVQAQYGGASTFGVTRSLGGLKPKDLVGIPWRVAFALQLDGWYLRSDIIWSKPNPMPESVTDRPTKAHEYVFLLTKSARYWYDAEAIREDNSPTSWTGGIYHKDAKDVRAGIRNDYFHRAGAVIPSNGRNRRTVWTIATQPYPEAHFATYPEKLVEPCVMAGCPAQVCGECGAPWERTKLAEWRGWRPTCICDAANHFETPTVPGTVADFFVGSGTTGAVACRLGRNFVGAELSPEYAEMAERRIAPHRDQMQLAVTT